MGSPAAAKPHAVCVPYPSQGHITPMLNVAKLLHSHGFHITFVNTEFNHNRLLRSGGPSAVEGLHDFVFETIPDGLPPSDLGATQDTPSICRAVTTNLLAPFRHLLQRLNGPASSTPPATCIVGDGVMSFTLDAAEELGVPEVVFWTTSACGFMGYLYFKDLIDRGLVPLKDAADLSNGYLDTPVDSVLGLRNMRMRDFPSFVRTTDPGEFMLNFMAGEAQRNRRAAAIVLNTFDYLERPVLDAMQSILPPVYTVGPLSLLYRRMAEGQLTSLGSSLWKEETSCLRWLEGREPRSVVYVNFGSITVMTREQLMEFAWGLANSSHYFLWVTRPDLVMGGSAALPPEFLTETKGRGLLARWCPQEEVLSHPAVGGFLTHNGWNSTLESITGGVPMICWPFFAEQQTNCRYACTEWGIGMEIDGRVRREEVEGLIRELMGGEKGKEMRRRAGEWKEGAVRATEPGGSSFLNFERVVEEVLLRCPEKSE